jgi:hypothetical protein
MNCRSKMVDEHQTIFGSSSRNASGRGSLLAIIISGHLTAYCKGSQQAQSSQYKYPAARHHPEEQVIPIDTEIVINNNVQFAEVGVHQRKG